MKHLMRIIFFTIVVLVVSSTANAEFSVQQFCENKYLDKYGYSQVEYCIKKQTKAAENLVEMNNNNGWRDEFNAVYDMCLDKYFRKFGPSQVEYCVKKDIRSWNRMNPYNLMELSE